MANPLGALTSGSMSPTNDLARLAAPAPPYQTKVTRGDFTALNNTVLNPAEEAQFQAYLQHNPQAARDLYNYDMRGAWKGNAQAAGNGHLPDTYKKPNHPTFSTGSQYSTPEAPGGEWIQQADGKWRFVATAANLQWQSPEDLQAYFARVEPGNAVVLPTDAAGGR